MRVLLSGASPGSNTRIIARDRGEREPGRAGPGEGAGRAGPERTGAGAGRTGRGPERLSRSPRRDARPPRAGRR
ncbi:MAG: hypothetical protein D3X82_08505 [Candidatus Leucobacter sulfamidivorax]|nr:hypothetical protein [Candidatus Leucobacter sulfamidivorax]